MAKNKSITFTVEGTSTFPYDMLRYDCCFPKTEHDSGEIERMGKRTVVLESRKLAGDGPTIGRWNSFGWKVIIKS
jgi:hypothetical protein